MIKILRIVKFYPNNDYPTGIVVSDVADANPQRQFVIRTGVTEEWLQMFAGDPSAFINKRAVIQTLPPENYKLRFPIFMGVVNVDKIDVIAPAAEYLDTPLPNGSTLRTEAPMTAFLGDNALKLEIADTPATAARGYMFRPKILPGNGMLFTKLEPGNFVFWMRNTYVPLDIIFINEQLRVSEIIHGMQPESEKLHVNKIPAVFAIEVPAGSILVKTGDLLSY